MSRQIFAIANCRVSSAEQVKNNSLNRQRMSVESAADRLGTKIIKVWSQSVSSKAGTNIKRKDLLEMLDFCKQNKGVKYAIFDEYDRFMRSVNEGPYFEILFQEHGVKVWYASESETFNGNDAMAKFMRTMSAFKAEGSNEERIRKSIAGQTTSLNQGRYPFSPKPGYKKGSERAIQEIHPIRGPILRDALLDIVMRRVTPTQALIEFNRTDFIKDHSLYKMDKFRKIITDPFYAGIVEIDKQVKVRNENGLHKALITKEQHFELVAIMNNKKKNQKGPRTNGNKQFPLSNLVTCDQCLDSTIGRLVGYEHSNGHSKHLTWEKYRCRACRKYLPKKDLHSQIEQCFNDNVMTDDGLNDFLEALNIVWGRQQTQARQDAIRIRHCIESLSISIQEQVEAATDPTNASIKQDILIMIAKKKTDINEYEDNLSKLSEEAEDDRERFLRFAINFVEDMGSQFLELPPENRLRCKLLVFPAGFYINADKKVYTTEISPLYRLATKKKSTEVLDNSLLVRVQGLKPWASSLARKRSIS
jgi:DNA invertase Pin-like site-specific DNA recombinase